MGRTGTGKQHGQEEDQNATIAIVVSASWHASWHPPMPTRNVVCGRWTLRRPVRTVKGVLGLGLVAGCPAVQTRCKLGLPSPPTGWPPPCDEEAPSPWRSAHPFRTIPRSHVRVSGVSPRNLRIVARETRRETAMRALARPPGSPVRRGGCGDLRWRRGVYLLGVLGPPAPLSYDNPKTPLPLDCAIGFLQHGGWLSARIFEQIPTGDSNPRAALNE